MMSQLSPAALYQQAIDTWLGEFTNAFLEGRKDKHEYRRAKLVEFLQALPRETLQELKTFVENKQVDNDAIYMEFPKPIHKKERATGRAVLTILNELTDTSHIQ